MYRVTVTVRVVAGSRVTVRVTVRFTVRVGLSRSSGLKDSLEACQEVCV